MKKMMAALIAAAFLSVAGAGISFAKDAEKEAGNTVSQAAHTAKAEGLKGQELAGKVHEAVDARKESRDALKDAKRESKEQAREARQETKQQRKETKTNFGAKNSRGKGKGNK